MGALLKGTDEPPEPACHASVSKTSKKGLLQNPVIRLAPVEEEKAGELTLLYARAYCGIKSKQGIGSPSPMLKTVLVIVERDMRAHPLQPQVAEEFADSRV
jgi:hypothetical protein